MASLIVFKNGSVGGVNHFDSVFTLTDIVVKHTGKPQKDVMVLFQDNLPIVADRATANPIYTELVVVGPLTQETKQNFARELDTFFRARWPIPGSRIFLKFTETNPWDFAMDGTLGAIADA